MKNKLKVTDDEKKSCLYCGNCFARDCEYLEKEMAEELDVAAHLLFKQTHVCKLFEAIYTADIIKKFNKDLQRASMALSTEEARYLVDMFYQIQDFRIAISGQIRSIDTPIYYDEAGKKRKPTEEEIEATVKEPHAVLDFMLDQISTLEKQIKKTLGYYTDSHPMGVWMKSIPGIGDTLSAGLLANIDIARNQTAGQIWSFAGLNPTAEWKKGEKRPWNAFLKVICWKIGKSFVKVSNNPDDIYGKIYKERKEYEQKKNEAGDYADQAAAKLEKYKIGKTTEAYKYYIAGKLPPAHIQARAERYAVKLFIAHMFQVWYKHHHKKDPPLPYPIAILGHAHMIDPPPMIGN